MNHRRNPFVHLANLDVSCYEREYAPADERADARRRHLRAWPDAVEAAITPRTRAIMLVHIYGLPVDLEPIMTIARKHDLRVIEDAAEMHGQTYRGKPCGGFGDLSTFSFYSNKHVTTGEGGMIVTDDDALADRCRSLRNLCFKPEQRFLHDELGWNFRMSNLQAALGLAASGGLDDWARDWAVATYADRQVAGLDARYTQPSWNFRDVFAAIGGSGAYPLATRTLANGRAEHVTLSAGSAGFLRFAVAAGQQASLTVRDAASPMPASVRLAVVRTR